MTDIYNVAIGTNFLSTVIDDLMQDMDCMLDSTIYVPNNRVCKALQTEILRRTDGKPTLMPVIKALGESDDIVDIESIVNQNTIHLVVNAMYRKFWLADAIRKFHMVKGDPISFASAFASADKLAKLFDDVAMFETDFSKFKQLFKMHDFAEHWGHSLAFLSPIYDAWQSELSKLQMLDIGVYKQQYLSALNEQLKSSENKIYLIGTTASYPSVSRIMQTVGKLENGKVFLAGYDQTFSDREQGNIIKDPAHPLHTIENFITGFGIDNITDISTNPNRAELLKTVFLSAPDTVSWKETKLSENCLDGISFITADDIGKESLAIALIMRESLEHSGKTCALITADRRLSRMVISLLNRWNIKVDDSSGQLLQSTPPAIFMRLVLDVVEDNFSSKSLASLFKHPFCCVGMDRGKFSWLAKKLELFGLRGYFGSGGIDSIIKYIEAKVKSPYNNIKYLGKVDSMIQCLRDVDVAFKPLLDTQLKFKDLVEAHISVCENLSASDFEPANNTLWNRDDGNELAKAMADILDNSEQIDTISLSDYKASFGELLMEKTVRKTIGLHPRLYIWGVVEARLQTVDIAIIGGMNEGILPAKVGVDPWLSRTMAFDVGLPISDYQIGISANDLITCLNSNKIIFTRSAKEDSKQTIASRWWQRFDAVIKSMAIDDLPTPNIDYLKLGKQLDSPSYAQEIAVKISVPQPTPPLESRPAKLSATNIQTWIEDPYQIYAKYILGLYSSGDISGKPQANIKGNIIHAILEEFVSNHLTNIPMDGYAELIEIGKKHFADYLEYAEVKAFWWANFEVMANKFIAESVSRNSEIERVICEEKGTLEITTVKGNKFKVSGRADRVEILNDGTAVMIDYKTGTASSKTKVKTGENPQLALESYILQQGGFKNIDKTTVSKMEIWLTKTNFKIDTFGVDKTAMLEIIERTMMVIEDLIDDYALFDTAYYKEKPTAKYSDYTHLSRIKEYSIIENADDGDEYG